MGGVGAFLMRTPFGQSGRPTVMITRVVTRIATTQGMRTPVAATPTPAEIERPQSDSTSQPTPTAATLLPTPEGSAAPTTAPAAAPDASTLDEVAMLEASEMPSADRRLLAMRLSPDGGNIPEIMTDSAPQYKVGDKQRFWISNQDTRDYTQITAELKYVTDVLAVWVQDGVRLNQNDLEASANRFTKETYPTNREFFGSEWKPGVDNDPRLHILHARGLGESVAGYYSSADEYARQVNEYSNEREMFYVSADSDNAEPNSTYYDGTLAHEFQHMIHWANDRNEASWVNEGLSELASYLNGFDPGGHDMSYALRPDTQLTTWGDPSEESVLEHYGASYLFAAYFLDRFGEDLTKAVVASDKNGIAGYDEALQQAGRPERFEDVFADWVIANYLDAPEADDEGRYGYSDIDLFPMAISEEYRRYPVSAKAQVSQYGADYIRLAGRQPIMIRFEGQQQVPLVNATPQGEYSWWSNRGDVSDSTLTRPVDLRTVISASLEFSAWFEIEDGWDYAYVEVSTDGGKRWNILEGKYTTDEDPVGNAFGPGWTGISGGGDEARWVEERVDLSHYAGKEILLRFEMVTDDAVNKPGLLIDNLRIPEISWQDEGEAGEGDWTADGWVLIDNSVKQDWLVQVLELGGGTLTVERLAVGPDGVGELRIDNMEDLQDVMMIVTALAPITTEKATYSYTITRD